MNRHFFVSVLILLIASFQFSPAKSAAAINHFAAAAEDDVQTDAEKAAVAQTNRLIAEIVEKSYPELRYIKISVKIFSQPLGLFSLAVFHLTVPDLSPAALHNFRQPARFREERSARRHSLDHRPRTRACRLLPSA